MRSTWPQRCRLSCSAPMSITASGGPDADRKSTRLNSSHSQISYAVFCLKKKKKRERHRDEVRRRVRAGGHTPRDPGRCLTDGDGNVDPASGSARHEIDDFVIQRLDRLDL